MRDRVLRWGGPAAAFAAALVVFPAATAGQSPTDSQAGGGERSVPGVLPEASGPGQAVPAGRAIDPRAVIVGSSRCPEPAAVWAELGTLVLGERLVSKFGPSSGAPPPPSEIIDLGVPYRVVAAGRVREYRDESRDCAHRARVAAVFIALALDLPQELEPPAPPPEPVAPPPPVAVTVAPATPPVTRAVRIEIGGELDAGVGAGDRILQAGAGLRLVVGGGAWGIVVGVSASPSFDTEVDGRRVRQRRVPIDLGVRAGINGQSLALYGELGVLAAVVTARAFDLATNDSNTSFEVGLRGAAGLRFFAGARLSPFVAASVELVPRPLDIVALPRGIIGHTPNLWLGATAGASLAF